MYSTYGRIYNMAMFQGNVWSVGILGFILLVLVVALKGLALWHAVKRGEKWWFVIMLIVNTAGLLELVYLAFVAKVKIEHIFPKIK